MLASNATPHWTVNSDGTKRISVDDIVLNTNSRYHDSANYRSSKQESQMVGIT